MAYLIHGPWIKLKFLRDGANYIRISRRVDGLNLAISNVGSKRRRPEKKKKVMKLKREHKAPHKTPTTNRSRAAAVLCALSFCLLAVGPAAGQARSKSVSTDALCRAIEQVGRAVRAEEKKRKTLLGRLKALKRTADRLQKQAAGPARDYRLRTAMKEARQMSKLLTVHDGRIARYRKMARRLRRRMKRLAKKLSKRQASKLSDCIKRAMPSKRAAAAQRGRLAKVKLDPLDGPREIEEKADLLADSADKLQKRLRTLHRAIRRVEKQVALRKASKRAEGRKALWGSGQPTRLTARPRTTPSVKTHQPAGTPPGGTPGPQNSSLYGDGRDDMDASFTAESDPSPGAGGPISVRTVWERTIGALRDLIDPSTAAALNKAMRSGNLATRLAALKKARQILARKTAELRKRSKRFRRRATDLRRKERRNRKTRSKSR